LIEKRRTQKAAACAWLSGQERAAVAGDRR
jgi:hypothetical protein